MNQQNPFKIKLARVYYVLIFLALAGFSSPVLAQKTDKIKTDTTRYESQAGMVSIGVRSILSCFTDGQVNALGYGAGAHVRVQLVERVNTEWFGDVITNNVLDKAHRTDFHIGWSVMYYLIPTRGFTRPLTPYVLAGHCFDETIVKLNGPNGSSGSRFSSAVQAGLGCHYNITPKFNLSLGVQYMLHLGKEIDAQQNPDGTMSIVTHKNAGWEGHLLVSISANFKLGRLWKSEE
jgi:opacity protein-like surface antigen